MEVLHIFVEGLLLDTLLLFPLIVLGGYLLARHGPIPSLRGALAVLIGWLVIVVGLELLSVSLGILDQLADITLGRGGRGVVRAELDFKLVLGGKYRHAVVLGVLIAYVVNILWARFTPAKYLFLNPVQLVLAASLLLLLFYRSRTDVYVAVPIVGLVLGSAMAWLPFLASRQGGLLNDSDIEIGSFHTLILQACAWVSMKLGSGPAVPGMGSAGAAAPPVLGGFVVGAVAFVLVLTAGDASVGGILDRLPAVGELPSKAGGTAVFGALLTGFGFSAGLWIVAKGADLTLPHLANGAAGLRRLVPGLRLAVDTLFLLPERPQVAALGFLLSLAGGMVGYFFLGKIGLVTLIPGMLVTYCAGHLLLGGAAATVSHRFGGLRGMLIVAPVHGLLLSVVTALAMTSSTQVGGRPMGIELGDLSILGAAVAWILKALS